MLSSLCCLRVPYPERQATAECHGKGGDKGIQRAVAQPEREDGWNCHRQAEYHQQHADNSTNDS